jgi:3-methyladenine DNA glycosylase AlkC
LSNLLKDRFFTPEFLRRLADEIAREYPAFDGERFLSLVHDERWEERELIDRMHHIARALGATLPPEYDRALDLLYRIAPFFSGFEGLLLSDFVAIHGEAEWERSMAALELFTQHGSAEFAVRGFIEQDPERALERLELWATHPNEHVRRLASEGSRPKLPWGKALRQFRTDPRPLLPILERLKDDDSEYVRRSVANNLNDISKDHPDIALDVAAEWIGSSPRTDAIVRHALRTLLKKGDPRALRLFGVEQADGLEIHALQIEPASVAIGESFRFSFELLVKGSEDRRVRLEYAIDFVKSAGTLSRKVFQIAERGYRAGHHSITRRHSMVDRTTRRHYPGTHRLTIIVNGVEMARREVEVRGT